jgi:hypothetical protein
VESVCPTLLKALLMLAATADTLTVAARARRATISAYSIRSCPRSSSRASLMPLILTLINIAIGRALALNQPGSPSYFTTHSKAFESPLREFVRILRIGYLWPRPGRRKRFAHQGC